MKTQEIRKLSDKELLKLKKRLEYNKIKSSSDWSIGLIKEKGLSSASRASTKGGTKTSLRKEIRRTIAKVNTIINERHVQAERQFKEVKQNGKFKRNSRRI